MIPGRKVVWLVVDSKLNFTKDKTEWNDTEVTFDISKKGTRTEVRFTHVGLVPDYECYGACSSAWGSYINGSLRSLIVTCPLCGSVEKISQLQGDSMGPGWWYCGACQDKFTVRVGTVMERSHIPLHKWLLAFRLMASSKKGVSAHKLHGTLGTTYKSAWFVAHRTR